MNYFIFAIKNIRRNVAHLLILLVLSLSPISGTMSEGVCERFAVFLNKTSSGPHGHGRGFLGVVERFHRRAKVWESINSRYLSKTDLLMPFIFFASGCIYFRAIDKKYFDEDYFPPTLCKKIITIFRKWDCYMDAFSTNVYSYRPGGRHRYDDLFIFQYEIEKARFIGEDCYLKSNLRTNRVFRPFFKKKGINPLTFDFSKDFIVKPKPTIVIKSVMKKSDARREFLIDSPCRFTGCTGVPPDPPIFIDSLSLKIVRYIFRHDPPGVLAIPALPRTLPRDFWRYMHEVRGIGFTVFMHLFPVLRNQCVGFEAYGMGREVIGDELYNELTRPFVQPPYELPASVFAEEAAMMADSGGAGGAAAASSAAASSSGTVTHESRALTSSSRPAAAASASCADLPDEADDASETDHLLEETGSYVRHRAAAMAAAAAVEKEVHTSSS